METQFHNSAWTTSNFTSIKLILVFLILLERRKPIVGGSTFFHVSTYTDVCGVHGRSTNFRLWISMVDFCNCSPYSSSYNLADTIRSTISNNLSWITFPQWGTVLYYKTTGNVKRFPYARQVDEDFPGNPYSVPTYKYDMLKTILLISIDLSSTW